jgi:alcohol dehydrogenase
MVIGAIYDMVPPDSSSRTVNDLYSIFNDNNCDSIIAVGGGSVIDTAKGVNILVTEQSDDLSQFAGAERLVKPMKPLIVVPTTSGTGSEVTLVAVIADKERKVKMLFTSNHLIPKVAVIDPRMTLSLPPFITAATGMDALTHAIEAFICLQKNPLSDSYSLTAIRLISENIITATKDGKNVDSRVAMSNASCMAGIAFSNSMVGMVHSLGHALGGVCGVPHGVAMNIFLPHVLEYNMKKVSPYIGELLLPISGTKMYSETPENERPQKTIGAIRALQNNLHDICKLPRTLKEAGVKNETFDEIAKTALNDGSLINSPEEMEYPDAMTILEKAYDS